MAASTGAAPLWSGKWKWGQKSGQAASSSSSSAVTIWGSREERRTRKGQFCRKLPHQRCQAGGGLVIQPVLAQVHPGEDHFPVAQAGQLMKGRQHRGGVQAAAGAPDPRHDAVAAVVAAALLDLEPGPGVAGDGVDRPGLEGRSGGESPPPSAAAPLDWASQRPGGRRWGEGIPRVSPPPQPSPLKGEGESGRASGARKSVNPGGAGAPGAASTTRRRW